MRFQISGPTSDTAGPVSSSKTMPTFEICSKICGLIYVCGSREHVNCDILCSLFHQVLSHFPFSDWLPRRPAYSLYVSFAITPIADGVDEWTVSVMTSKRPTSIETFWPLLHVRMAVLYCSIQDCHSNVSSIPRNLAYSLAKQIF